jgi:hypothetical protein
MSNSQSGRLRAPLVLIAALVLMSIGALSVQFVGQRGAAATERAAVPVTTSTTAPQVTTTTVAPTTATTATTTPPTTVPPPPPPPPAPVIPSGKGMWIWLPEYADQGDTPTIVARAVETGLTHLYVKTGSSHDGLVNQGFLDFLLPAAHAAGVKVIGWDFPELDDPAADAIRASNAIVYTTPSGDRIDGFSADIETPYEGVNLNPDTVTDYSRALREFTGPSYLLIATVPRPSPARQADYPYGHAVAYFDAIAPMVYWIDVPPDGAAIEALDFLAQFGKPMLPVGQAYDGGLEGGPPGTPTFDELSAFMHAANADGASGVSFWSWQHASDEMWAAIAAGPEVGVKPNG